MPEDDRTLSISERLTFAFESPLGGVAALAFVRDVPASLARADVLEGVQVVPGTPPLVQAALPVNTALFGRRLLPFASELHETRAGARLVPSTVAEAGRGWAEVGGEAVVAETLGGATVSYALDVTIHLELPPSERWGTRALTRMIEMTAQAVLRSLIERFPPAVAEAAAAYGAEGAKSAAP